MRIFKKTILSLICIAGALIAVLLVAVDPAQGEAGYHNPDLPPEIIVSDTLDLLTLNVAHGRGTALNQMLVSSARHHQNLEEIAAVFQTSGAHVVALQEADAASLWSGKFDHVAFLADITDYKFFVHGYHAAAWPYTYGAALMSRSQMSDTRSHRFRPSWPTATKGYVRSTIQWDNDVDKGAARPVTLVSLHLDFSREDVREAQIAEIVDDLRDLSSPLIIMGDFNADWSSEDSPVRVLTRELGLRAFEPTTTELGTYKGINRLDWILISDELKFIAYTVLPNIISDHLAVVARIGWEIHH